MKIAGCGAIPIATIMMTIGEMQKDGREVMVYDRDAQDGKKKFFVSMPKSLAEKLSVGDFITVVCTPAEDFSFATETLALTVKRAGESISYQLFDRDNYQKYLLIK
jgi:hypothetical protein